MHRLGSLCLRLLEQREEDVDLLAGIMGEPELLSMAFPDPPIPVAREALVQRLAAGSIAPLSAGPSDIEFAVVLAGSSRPVGVAGLYGFDRHHRVVEFGVILTAEARGHGHGAACLALLARWAFASHGMVKVFVQIKASNEPARRAIAGLGLPCHGILPAHRFVDGRHEALHIHGLLLEDWPATPLHALLDAESAR